MYYNISYYIIVTQLLINIADITIATRILIVWEKSKIFQRHINHSKQSKQIEGIFRITGYPICVIFYDIENCSRQNIVLKDL